MNDQSLPVLPEIRVGHRQELVEIEIKLDLVVEVVCDRAQFFPGNRTTPEERGGLIVEGVYLGGVDITKSLDESDLERIEAKCNGRGE
jgi:hypothetical protein